MNKSVITLSGIIGGIIYISVGEIGLAISARIPPPTWLHHKMEPFSWAVHVWRIVELSPFMIAAFIIGWGLTRIAKEGAMWAALISALVAGLVFGIRVASFASLLNLVAIFIICLLPVTVFLMRAYNKSLNKDASDAGAG